MLTGEQIDVPVAMKLGLVDFVVDDTENLDAVFERKLSNARGLNSHAKVLIRASTWGDSLYQSLSHFASDENTQLDTQDSECLSLSVSTQDKNCTLRIEDRTHRAGSFEIGQSLKKLMLQIKDVMEGDSATRVLKIEIAGSQTTSSEAGVDTVDASVSRSTQMLMINFLDHLQRIPHLTACTCEGDLSSLGICIICSCDWVSAHEDVVLPVSQLNSDNVLCPITLKCLEHRAGSTTLYSCLSARESIKSAELCRNGIVTEVVTASEEGSLQNAIARALKLPHLAASATTDMMGCSLTPGALMEAVWDFSLSTQDQIGDDPIYSVAESDSMLGSTFTVDVSCSVNDLEKRISILTSISALLDVGIAVGEQRFLVLDGLSGEESSASSSQREGDLKYSLIHAQTSLIRKLQDFSGILVVVSKGHMTSDALIAVGFADIVIAQDQATFSFPEVKRGLVPGMVSLAAKQRLPEHACRRLMLTGEQIDVPVAMKLGLVDYEVAQDWDVEKKAFLMRLRRTQKHLLSTIKTSLPVKSIEDASVIMSSLIFGEYDIDDKGGDDLIALSVDGSIACIELRTRHLTFAFASRFRSIVMSLQQDANI